MASARLAFYAAQREKVYALQRVAKKREAAFREEKNGAEISAVLTGQKRLNRDRRFDTRMRVVAFDFEVFEAVVENRLGFAFNHQLRQRARFAGKL